MSTATDVTRMPTQAIEREMRIVQMDIDSTRSRLDNGGLPPGRQVQRAEEHLQHQRHQLSALSSELMRRIKPRRRRSAA